MKWIIGISQQRRRYKREDLNEKRKRNVTAKELLKVTEEAPAVTLICASLHFKQPCSA